MSRVREAGGPEIRAIETRYRGYRFRSRLEARWAVLFDHLGVRWEYEKEGFSLPSGPYLPDFYVEVQGQAFWVEVKPNTKDGISDREWMLLSELSEATKLCAAFFIGVPGEHRACWWQGEYPNIKVPAFQACPCMIVDTAYDEMQMRMQCPVCGFNYVHFETSEGSRERWSGECGHEWRTEFKSHKGEMLLNVDECKYTLNGHLDSFIALGDDAKLEAGIAKARSARFEHGEAP